MQKETLKQINEYAKILKLKIPEDISKIKKIIIEIESSIEYYKYLQEKYKKQ